MRGGAWIGLALAMALGCGSGKTDDFGDEPEKRDGGSGGDGAAAMGGSAMAVCAPGSTQACFGPGQCPGAQRCSAQGDGWGECDCGAAVSGSGGSDTASAGGQGASGGTQDNGGTDNGGTSSGRGGTSSDNGGTRGGGAGKGGDSGAEPCDTEFCGAYCDAATGHCEMDGSREDCMTQCTETRCTT
jgi:hypothetical protein